MLENVVLTGVEPPTRMTLHVSTIPAYFSDIDVENTETGNTLLPGVSRGLIRCRLEVLLSPGCSVLLPEWSSCTASLALPAASLEMSQVCDGINDGKCSGFSLV